MDQPSPDTASQHEHDASTLKSSGGLGRISKAIVYSSQGLAHAVRHEAAFRQELVIAIPAIIGLWFLPVTMLEKIALLATVVLMLIVELLNSAIEAVVDRVSTERHPLSGRAKDMGSAAVLLAVLLMLITWGLIVAPVLFKFCIG